MEEERDGSADEAVSAWQRNAHEAKLAALRAAPIEGEQGGPSTPFDFETFIGGKRASRRRVI